MPNLKELFDNREELLRTLAVLVLQQRNGNLPSKDDINPTVVAVRQELKRDDQNRDYFEQLLGNTSTH